SCYPGASHCQLNNTSPSIRFSLYAYLDGVPNDDIGKHLFWLSEKLGRTPFSVACKIASQRHLTNGWKEQFREVSDKIRLSGLSISDYLKQNRSDLNA
ncbi:hypothetical protein V6126_25125, partial [Klebsiella pneumoniae]